MPAINIKGGNDNEITNNVFSGHETAIEMENVKRTLIDKNIFVTNPNTEHELSELKKSIMNSALDNEARIELIKDVTKFLESDLKDKAKENSLTNKLKALGGKAAQHFISLVTQVAAALIAKNI